MTGNKKAPTAADLADRASEAVRGLNHATLPAGGFPGLEWPSDAYDVLGALAEAARRLPQALGQVAAFLRAQQDRPGLYDDTGADPATRIAAATAHLDGARQALTQAATLLGAAQRSTSGLGIHSGGGR